jgi:hypothetical protein
MEIEEETIGSSWRAILTVPTLPAVFLVGCMERARQRIGDGFI